MRSGVVMERVSVSQGAARCCEGMKLGRTAGVLGCCCGACTVRGGRWGSAGVGIGACVFGGNDDCVDWDMAIFMESACLSRGSCIRPSFLLDEAGARVVPSAGGALGPSLW